MKKLFVVLFIFLTTLSFAQQKYALVIGNGNYTGISRLNNPANDANDMENTLISLGFTVEKVLNGDLEQIENAVLNLKRMLGGARNTYGFFFYAGHGVQANGENYLIPVNADNIRSETQLRNRAVSLQFVLDTMNEAGNELNMVVLDACRDNPFSWARSGSRGLSVVSQAPTGTIVMYATGANSTAADGTERNGLFTGHLLKNLKTPGLSVFDVFDKTMGDVIDVTKGTQHPELSLRYAGASRAYLGAQPVEAATPTETAQPVLFLPIQPPDAQPQKPAQPDETVKASNARNNWFSGELVGTIGLDTYSGKGFSGGARYERMIGPKVSLGVNVYGGVFSLDDYGNSNAFEIAASVRWYPWGKTFYLGTGVGYNYFNTEISYTETYSTGGPYNTETSYTYTGDMTMSGVLINLEMGWKIDVGNPGGFYIQFGIAGSFLFETGEIIYNNSGAYNGNSGAYNGSGGVYNGEKNFYKENNDISTGWTQIRPYLSMGYAF